MLGPASRSLSFPNESGWRAVGGVNEQDSAASLAELLCNGPKGSRGALLFLQLGFFGGFVFVFLVFSRQPVSEKEKKKRNLAPQTFRQENNGPVSLCD